MMKKSVLKSRDSRWVVAEEEGNEVRKRDTSTSRRIVFQEQHF